MTISSLRAVYDVSELTEAGGEIEVSGAAGPEERLRKMFFTSFQPLRIFVASILLYPV